jgi:hypothetical protein
MLTDFIPYSWKIVEMFSLPYASIEGLQQAGRSPSVSNKRGVITAKKERSTI